MLRHAQTDTRVDDHPTRVPLFVPDGGRRAGTVHLSRPDGQIQDLDILVVPSGEWYGRLEASDPSWATLALGGHVIGFRLSV